MTAPTPQLKIAELSRDYEKVKEIAHGTCLVRPMMPTSLCLMIRNENTTITSNENPLTIENEIQLKSTTGSEVNGSVPPVLV